MSSRIRVLHLQGYQHEATGREHSVVIDEPEEVGGSDTGLTPYELLLGALGGCMAITVRMYAERKGWDLQDLRVDLSHDRVHAEDCRECATKEGSLTVVRRRIEMTGELDDEQRAKLLEIARRCPVHRTLEGTVEIVDDD